LTQEKSVKVLDKTTDILYLFMEKKRPLGITEISKELLLYKSAVHRILNTLKSRGFIVQDGQTKKYWLGSQFYTLGMLFKNSLKLRDIATKYMEILAERFKETVHLTIYDEVNYGRVVCVEKVQASHLLSMSPPVGSKSPTHASAVGKALLAYSGDDIQNMVLNGELKSYTKQTITDREQLKEELVKIREKEYAMDNEELENGLVCLAAPILNSENTSIASISVSGPRGRIIEKKDEIIEQIIQGSKRISYELK